MAVMPLLVLTAFYDTVDAGGAMPNTLTIMEEGFALYAASDPQCCFLNMFGYGANHEQLVLDGVWDGGESVPNEVGKKYWLLDFNGLARRAAAEAGSVTTNRLSIGLGIGL
jgi:hypothetical protein